MELRDYQKECINTIEKLEKGSFLIQMATGLGKTVTFANIPRKGSVLVLAHREELIKQPIKYYNCSVGVEMGRDKSKGEEVVIASVQSLIHRLDKFKETDFDMIITDESHHAVAASYKKIYNYFKPRLLLGFTATPNRGDKVRLDDVFSEIVFQRDLTWAIKNKYLCDIKCMRVDIGYDLTKVAVKMGDFAQGDLEKTMNVEILNQAIAQAYKKFSQGQTLIFATSVEHAKAIASLIPGAVAVTADSKKREEIVNKFTNKEIPVLVNCMIFTEGTDLPLVQTVIIARPTKSESLYTQMVGRGLRLHPDKDRLILIDCVGTSTDNEVCTAPSLLGINMKEVPKRVSDEIQGNLFDLPQLIYKKMDTPSEWIRNVEIVELWAKTQKYRTYNINFFKTPEGDLILSLRKNIKYKIAAQDELGMTTYSSGKKVPMQQAIDTLYKMLVSKYNDQRDIWDLEYCKRWANQKPSDKQINLIQNKTKEIDTANLNRFEASLIINRILMKA